MNKCNMCDIIGNASSLLHKVNDISDANFITSEKTGFPNLTDSVISFDEGTRTLTIQPSSSSFEIYFGSKKIIKRLPETKQIDDIEGIWFFYYDLNGIIQATQTFLNDMILKYVLIQIIYWDATNKELLIDDAFEERHGMAFPGIVHLRWHEVFGANLQSGAALNSILADQDGSLATHAQLGVDSAVFWDEDIQHILGSMAAPAQINVIYKDGASGNWRYKTKDTFPVINFSGGSNRLAYNQFTGGAWQQTEVTNGRYLLSHAWLINGVSNKIIFIQGQAEYNNIIDARNGANTEIANLFLAGLPSLEMIPIASVIYQTSDVYTNSVNARIRTTDLGDDYVDFRGEQLSSSGSPSDHSFLAGRGATASHPETAINGTSQILTSLAGVVNFNILLGRTGILVFTEDVTDLNITGIVAGERYYLECIQDSSANGWGIQSGAWDSFVEFQGGTKPKFSITANAKDKIGFHTSDGVSLTGMTGYLFS